MEGIAGPAAAVNAGGPAPDEHDGLLDELGDEETNDRLVHLLSDLVGDDFSDDDGEEGGAEEGGQGAGAQGNGAWSSAAASSSAPRAMRGG